MKKTLTKLLALSGICMLMLSACKKDGTLVTSNGGTPGALTATTSTLILNKANNGDGATSVITFNFTQPTYGFQAAVTNTLQIDPIGDNWANPTSVTLGVNATTVSYTTPAFNALLLKLKLVGGVTSTVNVRVVQSISAGITPVYSNVLPVVVTPYNLASWLYLVGGFNGYSTATADSLYSPTSNGIYTGIINVTSTSNTRFLVLPARNYSNKYATVTSPGATGTSLTYASEYVTGGGNDFYTPSAVGYYFISLNTNTNSITVALANTYSAIGNTSGEPSGSSYSIDVPLTKYVNDGFTGWQGTVGLTGAFKIRQNNDWTYSWGVPKAGSAGDGVANTLNDTSNDNISVSTSKNYTVSFNIAASAKGASAANSTPPSVTATYKLQ
jgi:hypothetical protein